MKPTSALYWVMGYVTSFLQELPYLPGQSCCGEGPEVGPQCLAPSHCLMSGSCHRWQPDSSPCLSSQTGWVFGVSA